MVSSDRQSGKADRGDRSKPRSDRAPAEKTATADVRSGFDAVGSQPILPGAGNAAAPASEPGSQLALGIGLLAFGVLALLGGFGVAATRRRRALAGPEDSHPSS